MGFRKTIIVSLIAASATASLVLVARTHRSANEQQFASQGLSIGTSVKQRAQSDSTATPMADAGVSGLVPRTAPPNQPTRQRHLVDDPKALVVAAASPKPLDLPALEDSDRLSIAASEVALWNPQTPAELVRGFPGADKSLVKWLTDWQNQFVSGKVESQPSLSTLQTALENSQLTPRECVETVSVLTGWEDTGDLNGIGYHQVSGAFASQAIFAASEGINRQPDQRLPLMDLVAPLIRRLWEGNGIQLKAVEQYYSVLANYEPRGSTQWLRGCTGRIEAMSMQQHYNQALAAVNDLEKDLPVMTDEQRAAVSYSKGMTLFGAERYTEAVPALRETANNPTNGNHVDAQAILVIALARTNKITDARKECAAMEKSAEHSVLFTAARIAVHAAERSADPSKGDFQ